MLRRVKYVLGDRVLMKWLIIDDGTYEENLAVFLQLETLTNQVAGYPNEATKTMKYADPLVHPDSVRVAFPVSTAIEQAYYNDPTVTNFVDALVVDAPNKLVDFLTLDWMPDGGDGV